MKNWFSTILMALGGAVVLSSFGTVVLGKRDGTEPGHTGSPGDSLKNCTVCHGGTAENVDGWISSNIPAEGFTPGSRYTIVATNTEFGNTRFGFQVSPQALNGNLLGTLIITDTFSTKLVGDNKYVTYRENGVFGQDYRSWEFDWIAPEGVDEVIFYGAFNSNHDGHKGGDKTYLSTLKVFRKGFVGVREVQAISGICVFPNPVKDHTKLSFDIKLAGRLKVSLYTLTGQKVTEWFNQEVTTGAFEANFTPQVNAGIYLVNIDLNGKQYLQKLVVE